MALEEIATYMPEGLLALAVGAGLQVMQQRMEADVAAVCGQRANTIPAGRPYTMAARPAR